MTLRRYRPTGVVLLLLHLGACTTWSPVTLSPRQLIEQEQPENIRITGANGTVASVQDPLIRNDSIAGIACLPGGECTAHRGLIPLDDVIGIEVRGLGNAMGWLGAAAEYYLSGGRFSGFGGVGYTPEIDEGDPTGLTFAAGARAYTLGIKHRGFAELSFSQVAITSLPAFLGGGERHYGPGIQLGYQHVRPGGFTFMVSGGVGYALGVEEFVTGSRFGPLLNLGLGYTWRRP